ncbi:MAG: VOC family protein [Reichenbachiella sp.]
MNLNQVTIASSNIDRSAKYYQALGLKLIVFSKDHYARFECPDGESTFSLHKVEEVEGNNATIYFECEALDETVESLEKQGFEFDVQPTDQTWLWREARLRDPDGNRLILYYAGENRLNPPWRIK